MNCVKALRKDSEFVIFERYENQTTETAETGGKEMAPAWSRNSI